MSSSCMAASAGQGRSSHMSMPVSMQQHAPKQESSGITNKAAKLPVSRLMTRNKEYVCTTSHEPVP
jgi:hypothetical protein